MDSRGFLGLISDGDSIKRRHKKNKNKTYGRLVKIETVYSIRFAMKSFYCQTKKKIDRKSVFSDNQKISMYTDIHKIKLLQYLFICIRSLYSEVHLLNWYLFL